MSFPEAPPSAPRHRAWLCSLLVAVGFLAAWEADSRWLLPRIPQPDDSRGFTILKSSDEAPIGSHVDGSIRFRVQDEEVLCLAPGGVIYIHSRVAANDVEVILALRSFLDGCTTTDSRGRENAMGTREDANDFVFQSGRAARGGDGGDVVIDNSAKLDYTKQPTTRFHLPWTDGNIVGAALQRTPPPGYVFDHVTRQENGDCTIFWKKAP